MLDQRLREAWRARERGVPISAELNFTRDGLVLGAGTVIVSAERPRLLKSSEGEEARILALLSAAYGKAVPPSVLGNIRRAAKAWRAGDDCLAYVHLAHAGLQPLHDYEESAYRLSLADSAMKAGGRPRAVCEALHLNTLYIDTVEKFYNPDEPRVPAGSGRASGEWTDSDQTQANDAARETAAREWSQGSSLLASVPLRASSFLSEFDAAQLAQLGLYIARVVGPAGGAAAVFGLLFIPSPNNVHVEGQVSGVPGLRYSWNRDEALLHFTYDISDGEQRTFAAYVDGDKFRDEQGRVVGRVLPGGTIAIDPAAISPDLVRKDEPRLCPAPVKDNRTNNKGLAYEMYVRGIINPGNPTPPGLAYKLPNPKDSDKMVSYDDCERATASFLAETKDQYTGLLRFPSGIQSVAEGFLDQAKRQVDASGTYEVRWYFSEQETADFTEELFRKMDKGRERIKIIWQPWPGKNP